MLLLDANSVDKRSFRKQYFYSSQSLSLENSYCTLAVVDDVTHNKYFRCAGNCADHMQLNVASA